MRPYWIYVGNIGDTLSSFPCKPLLSTETKFHCDTCNFTVNVIHQVVPEYTEPYGINSEGEYMIYTKATGFAQGPNGSIHREPLFKFRQKDGKICNPRGCYGASQSSFRPDINEN